jgi:hypothetical protein
MTHSFARRNPSSSHCVQHCPSIRALDWLPTITRTACGVRIHSPYPFQFPQFRILPNNQYLRTGQHRTISGGVGRGGRAAERRVGRRVTGAGQRGEGRRCPGERTERTDANGTGWNPGRLEGANPIPGGFSGGWMGCVAYPLGHEKAHSVSRVGAVGWGGLQEQHSNHDNPGANRDEDPSKELYHFLFHAWPFALLITWRNTDSTSTA